MAIAEELAALRERTLAEIAAADTSAALEAVRVAVLGKSGTLTGYLRSMGQVPAEERASVGKAVNAARVEVEEALAARKAALDAAELEAAMGAAAVDVTLPGRAQQVGTRHLINGIIDEVSDIFLGLGYKVVEGEEIETDYYNFTALNAPADHPSRSMQDTFYVHDLSGDTSRVRGESDVLLRTQTSGVQVHVMEDWELPIYMIAPGKVYRRDVADPSHLPQFHQIEGLVVDRGITFGDLKGTLDYVCKQIFGPERKTRFRPLLPVHGALGRGGRELRHLPRRGLPHVQGHRLDRDLGLRHGGPERAFHERHRPGGVLGVRFRHGGGAHRLPEVRRAGFAYAFGRRHAVLAAILVVALPGSGFRVVLSRSDSPRSAEMPTGHFRSLRNSLGEHHSKSLCAWSR